MRNQPSKTDPVKFGLHFGCGTLVGVGLGLYVVIDLIDSLPVAVAVVAVVAIATGLVAGFQGDRFWSSWGGWW